MKTIVLFLTLCLQTVTIIKCFSLYSPTSTILNIVKRDRKLLQQWIISWFSKKSFKFCRFTLKPEEENRRNADMLCEKMMEHLRRKEDEYSKEVEVKQQLELTFRAVEVKLKTERNNLNQVE